MSYPSYVLFGYFLAMSFFARQKIEPEEPWFIKKGYKADLVLFNPETIINKATREKQHFFPREFDMFGLTEL